MDAARVALAVLLLVNLLDFTTSLVPSPADHLWPIPDKPLWLWALQGALVVPLGWLVFSAREAIALHLRAIPAPFPAKAALLAFLAVAGLHVALRMENYPFSPVTMFSSGVPERRGDLVETHGYLVTHPGGIEAVSWLREGNPLFARHDFGWDYKAGWAMQIYSFRSSAGRDLVEAQMAAEGLPAPQRARYFYRRADGRLELAPPR